MMHFLKGAARALPILLTLGIGGCKDFLDVNTNPNAPEFANIELRLPALVTQFVHSSYYGETSLWGSEWTQQFSFNRDSRSYGQVQRYEISENSGTSAWDYLYSRPGAGANQMILDAKGATDNYYRGIGYLFRAWTFQILTDHWGPVPYVQAFDPTIREPKYDDQKTVYEGIFRDLDSAVVLLSATTGRRPTSNDLLFAGDVTRWVKLAKFLQARANLRVSGATGEDKTARANKALAALAGALTGNADDADFIYPGGSGARNPLYTFFELRGTFVGAQYMIESMKARNDPRIGILFSAIPYDSIRGTGTARVLYPAKPNTFVGMQEGSSTLNDSTVSWIGPYFSTDSSRLSVVSYSDQKFTEAELRLIVSGAAAADVPYRDGIRAHMQKLGVPAAAITAYVNARPTLTAANALEEIIAQKYIANFLKVEPWNDWRRTGFPRLTPVANALLPNIPQRIRTPGSELSNNINQVTATGIPTGLDGMLVKVWWAGGTR